MRARQKLAHWILFFGIPTAAMWGIVNVVVPAAIHRQWHPTTGWLIGAGAMFSMMLCGAWIGSRAQSKDAKPFAARVGIRKPTRKELALTLAVFTLSGAVSLITIVAWREFHESTGLLWRPKLHPDFLWLAPLTAETRLLYVGWVTLLALNVVGEECWWRGYLLPIERDMHGGRAWILHGLGFTLYHLPIGLDLTIILAPFLFAMPFLAQRTQSISSSILLHATLNGGGMLALAMGALGR